MDQHTFISCPSHQVPMSSHRTLIPPPHPSWWEVRWRGFECVYSVIDNVQCVCMIALVVVICVLYYVASYIPGLMHRITKTGLVRLGRFSLCAESVYYVSNYISHWMHHSRQLLIMDRCVESPCKGVTKGESLEARTACNISCAKGSISAW